MGEPLIWKQEENLFEPHLGPTPTTPNTHTPLGDFSVTLAGIGGEGGEVR